MDANKMSEQFEIMGNVMRIQSIIDRQVNIIINARSLPNASRIPIDTNMDRINHIAAILLKDIADSLEDS